jgi:plastocyanin
MDRSLTFPFAALAVAVAGIAGAGCAPAGHSGENAARRQQVAAEAATMPTAPIGRQLQTDDGSPAGTVVVKHTAFTPTSFTITAGQAMLWNFDDGSLVHRITGDGFDSGPKTTGFFSHTFGAPGRFAYHCSIHPAMTGTITVTDR